MYLLIGLRIQKWLFWLWAVNLPHGKFPFPNCIHPVLLEQTPSLTRKHKQKQNKAKISSNWGRLFFGFCFFPQTLTIALRVYFLSETHSISGGHAWRCDLCVNTCCRQALCFLPPREFSVGKGLPLPHSLFLFLHPVQVGTFFPGHATWSFSRMQRVFPAPPVCIALSSQIKDAPGQGPDLRFVPASLASCEAHSGSPTSVFD